MNSKNIAANYDLPLDVLHIAVGKPRPYHVSDVRSYETDWLT